jgi:hypothetical protein
MDTTSTAVTEANGFEKTAVKLSQGPLGIIALFIVLIHGFASLVLGISPNLGEANRSVMVWFLVLFPVFVFTVFAWLVGTCHEKLYPPTAFRNENIFRDLAFGRASFDHVRFRPASTERTAANAEAVNKGAIGNLFWLGHDLMWTADMLLRQGPSAEVLIGLDQAIHHLARAGLSVTPMASDLQALRTQIQADSALTTASRDEAAKLLGSVIDRLGAVLEAAQGDFQLPPHWSRMRT